MSALVILHTAGGSNDSGAFPDGVFAGDMGKAVVYANGRRIQASWTRYPHPIPITIERPGTGLLSLPQGPVWFHIVTSEADYEVIASVG